MSTHADRSRVIGALLLLILTALLSAVAVAQESPAAALFDDARTMEVALRKEIGVYRAGAPALPLLRRARILVGTYEDIARLFPDGSYGDKALWQGASLAADVFDVFGDGTDRAAAIRLTERLDTTYSSSSFLAQAHRRIGSLKLPVATPGSALEQPAPASGVGTSAVPAPVPAASPASTQPARPAATAAPRPPAKAPVKAATAARSTTLTAIRREVLPGVLRVSLELDREVPFHDERLEGPSRVFVDMQNTRTSTDIQDARLSFDDDVVRQIRVGRQLDRRVRVVLDLDHAPAHTVYTLYDPFRIVIDFERPRADAALASSEPVKTLDAAPTAKAVAAVQPPAVTALPPPASARTMVPTTAAAATAPAAATSTPAAAPAAAVTAAPPATIKREATAVVAIPPPPRPGGLSMSRQLGLGVGRVVIDPGHGGHDPGAKQGDVTESELVLDVALRLEQLLQKEGIEVVLTRRSNTYIALEERPAIALREEADLYLSIHANASSDRRVRGVETYILNFAANARSAAVAARENRGSSRTMSNLPDIVKTIALNNKIDESRDLARLVQASLIEKLSKGNPALRNLGVKQAPFAVLVGTDMPSILAEIGFITNKQDAALVKTAVYRQKIAEALASGILRYQKALKPVQVAQGQ